MQVGILHGIMEGGIKCPVYIVVMTVALPCSDDTSQHLFASWSLSTMAVVYGDGGGMEPTAPIVVVDNGFVNGCNGGKEPTASIIVVDDGDGDHHRLQ